MIKVKKTKTYQLFACLGLQERKDFTRFLSQHSQPKKQKLRASMRYLCSHSERIEAGLQDAEDWWRFVFPELPYHAQQMRKHQNALTTDLEAFLIVRKLRKEADLFLAQIREGEQLILLLSSLFEREKDALFLSYFKRAKSLVDELPEDGDSHLLRYRLELLRIAYKQKTKPSAPIEEFMSGQLALDQFFILNSLRMELASRNQRKINARQLSLGRLDAVHSLLAINPIHDPLTTSYLSVLDMGDAFSYEDWQGHFHFLQTHATRMAPDAWRDQMAIMLNLAIRRINEGQPAFQFAALDVYIALLAAGILQLDTVGYRANLMNIVQLAFNCHSNERLTAYIQAQATSMAKEGVFANVLPFYQCLAIFSNRDYDQACGNFMRVWLLEADRKIRYAAGVFILRCHYELGEIDHLRQFTGDFQRIVSHDARMDEVRKASYREFFQAIRVLCRIQFHGVKRTNKAHLKALEAKATASPFLISRSWILEKIEQLWEKV
jgi:hypothetical protein